MDGSVTGEQVIGASSLHRDGDLPLSPLRTVETLDDIEGLLFDRSGEDTGSGAAIMLLLVYNDNCKYCADLMVTMEDAWWKVSEATTAATSGSSQSRDRSPIFGKMDTEMADQAVVQDMLGVEKVPSLIFVISRRTIGNNESQPFTYTQQYAGKSQTSLEIFHTVMHAWYFNVVGRGEITLLNESDAARINPKRFQSVQDCFEFFRSHELYYLDRTRVEPALPPTLTKEETEYAKWLLKDNSVGEDFLLVVQCRTQEDVVHSSHGASRNEAEKRDVDIPELYAAYNSVLETASGMRDRLLLAISDCNIDGAVAAYHIRKDTDIDSDDWAEDIPRMEFIPSNGDNDSPQKLVEFLVRALTPSLLWFDRQSTAPIAFPRYRKLHATLFVDLHTLPDESNESLYQYVMDQRHAVADFRRICRSHRRLNTDIDRDLVCLAVPSIEHRVLNVYGVVIWSPLDAEAVNVTGSKDQVLPSIIITDGRETAGLKRYVFPVLDFKKSVLAMQYFFDRFWDDELQPQVTSSSQDSHVQRNSAGVQILTASNADAAISSQEKEEFHKLIMFTSSTCGHCKRFSVVWNELASLLRGLGWDSFVDLYKFDVDSDEIPVSWNITVRWVPDMYYLPPSVEESQASTAWRPFDWSDIIGDGVGRVSSPVEILEWLLHTGSFPEEQLKEMLNSLDG